MRIGPRSELMTGGLRTSTCGQGFPPGSRDSWQDPHRLPSGREGFFCNHDDHSNIVPSSRRLKNDNSLIYDFGHGDESVRIQRRR